MQDEFPWFIELQVASDAPPAANVYKNPVTGTATADPTRFGADITLWLDGDYLARIEVMWLDEEWPELPSPESFTRQASCDIPKRWASRGQLRSCIESEHELVRFLVAPMSEPAPLAHDQETALRQHTNRRGVVARSVSVKRTG